MRRVIIRTLVRSGQAAVALTALGSAFIAIDPARRDGVVRSARVAKQGILIAYDYKTVLGPAEKEHGDESEHYRSVKSTVDKRSAERLLKLCLLNGGIYTKLAQVLSTHNFSLPREYTETLAAAQDKAVALPWRDVRQVFEEDCGQSPDAVFQSIEELPVAAASLAQVHRAVTKDGQPVAVKIQYPRLRRQIVADLAAIHFFAAVIELFFPDFGYTWLLPDFESTLRAEVNFLQEARNGERVRAQFAGDPRVHVPAVLPALSTERVLVMEWIDGCKVNDRAALRSRFGLVDTTPIARKLCGVYGDMMFLHGLVHCDPHPGNLMVRSVATSTANAAGAAAAAATPGASPFVAPTPAAPASDWQLVILDHGMYRRLTPHFRHAFAALFRGLLLGETAASLAAVADLGLQPDKHYEALSLILVYRPVRRAGSVSALVLGGKLSQAEVARLRATTPTAADVNRFMQALPRDLLFVLRGLSMVRAINKDLGGSSRTRFEALGEAAIRGLTLLPPPPKRPAAAAADAAAGGVVGASGAAESAVELDVAVADVPKGTAFGSGGSSLVQAALLWAQRAFGRPPPREPLTYVNALARGAFLNDPTESEAVAATRAAQRAAAPAAWWLGAVWRSAACAVDSWRLNALLAWYDALWRAVLAAGGLGFEAHEGEAKSPHRGQNPG